MKIFLVGEFSFGSLGLSYNNAFKSLGHEVFCFDAYAELRKVNKFSFNQYLSKIFDVFFVHFVEKKLFQTISVFKPELILVIKGVIITPQLLQKIKTELKIKIFCFNPDNPFNLNRGASNDFIRKSIPIYDAYFIWGKFLIDKLKIVGANFVYYLPFAYDPELHYPVNVSELDKKMFGSDLAFIGSYDKEREEFLAKLTSFDLAIWGNGWAKSLKLRKFWRRRDVMGEDFSKVCNSSKIILNHIREQNGDAHNMKTFEIPACGGFMVTKRTKEQSEFYIEGKEIICFNGPDELMDVISYYINRPIERSMITKNGRKKVETQTYLERANEVIKVYRNLL